MRCICRRGNTLPPILVDPKQRFHCFNCTALAGGIQERHNALQNVLVTAIQMDGGNLINVVTPTINYQGRINGIVNVLTPDISLELQEGGVMKKIAVDVTVINQSCPTHINKTISEVTEWKERLKLDHYRLADDMDGVELIPFVVTTTGILGKMAENFISRLNSLTGSDVFNSKLRRSIAFVVYKNNSKAIKSFNDHVYNRSINRLNSIRR